MKTQDLFKAFLIAGMLVVGSSMKGYADSSIRDLLGSFEDTKNLNSTEFRKGILTWIPKEQEISVQSILKDFSDDPDADLTDPYLQDGKIQLSILDDSGKAQHTYTFLVRPEAVIKDKKDVKLRNRVKYHVVSTAEEDYEVEGAIYVAKIKYSQHEQDLVCDYVKIVSLVVLKEVLLSGNASDVPRNIGKYKSGNDDSFLIGCK